MIPSFLSINDLHQAVYSGLETRFSDFHIFRNHTTSKEMLKKMYPHKCGFHQICLDYESDYRIGLDEDWYSVSNNNLYFIPKGTIISWESEYDDLWKGFTIMFKAAFLDMHFQSGLGNFFKDGKARIYSIDRRQSAHLSELCERMIDEQHGHFANVEMALKALFSLFLLYSDRFCDVLEKGDIPLDSLKLI